MASGKQSPLVLVAIIALPVLGWQVFIRYVKHRQKSAVAATQNAARDDILRAKKTATERADEVRAAIANAHEKPPAAAGPCPIRVPVPPPMNGKAKTSFDNANEAVGAALGGAAFLESMTVTRKQDLATLEARSTARWLSEIRSLESQLSGSELPEDFAERVRKVASTELAWDLVLVVDNEKLSSVDMEAKTFMPGHLDGRAYLYDYKKRAVVCTSAVDVANSDAVSVEMIKGSVYSTLMMDLRAEALRSAAERLAAVSP